jgi:hypothetical protein
MQNFSFSLLYSQTFGVASRLAMSDFSDFLHEHKGVFLLGLLLKILRSGQELIVFSSLLTGKPGFQVWLKRGFPAFVQIIFPLCSIV